MSHDAATQPPTVVTDQAGPELDVVRARRAHLRRSCQALEAALSAPVAGSAWTAQVRLSLDRVRTAVDAHVSITEGTDGLFDQIRTDAPRLEPALRRLAREHVDLAKRLSATAAHLDSADVDPAARDTVREELTRALGLLVRHRQRGADLLYQAYQLDIGGE